MFLSSTESDYKIYVIDDAESMTTEAQNALLKVLEEPPKSVMIIMLAKECDRILTTIKSRAQYIAMGRFDDEKLAEILLSESAEARSLKAQGEENFLSLIKSADGRLGLAKRLVNKKQANDIEEGRADTIRLISAIGQKTTYSGIYSALSHFPTKRAELSIALEQVMIALRDLIVLNYNENAKTLFFSGAEEAKRLCPNISTERLISVYDAISDAHELCAQNANVQNLISSLCSNIRFGMIN
jgi:DNA polymerase-3 subunit delta'